MKWLACSFAAEAIFAARPSIAQTNPATWRPIVYDQTHWNLPGTFQGSNGDLLPAYKTVIQANGSGVETKVFHSVRVQSATIN